MRKLLFFLSFSFIVSVKASAVERLDSIGVENSNGKEIVIHKVEAKETYYSLGRQYNISPKNIIDYNNNLPLKIGTLVKIPTNRDFSSKNTGIPQTTTPADNLIDYKVGPKETLYAIARRFDTTVEDIKKINNLTGNSLHVGQIVKVKQGGTAYIPETSPVVPVANNNSDSDIDEENRPKITANRYGIREMSERGVAVWIADENLDGTKMLALHRNAPIGTIIKVTNPMTERSTFAKVVGKFTENESTRDVLIVVTKATADLLGALDKRFQVNLAYGVPNIENE